MKNGTEGRARFVKRLPHIHITSSVDNVGKWEHKVLLPIACLSLFLPRLEIMLIFPPPMYVFSFQ
jgi:hypothetical protein